MIIKKQDAIEIGLSEPIASIQLFILEEFERIEKLIPQRVRKNEPLEKLNLIFQSTLLENW